MTEALWVNLFVTKIHLLGVKADFGLIAALAVEIYKTFGAENPVDVAQATWDTWPPHDD